MPGSQLTDTQSCGRASSQLTCVSPSTTQTPPSHSSVPLQRSPSSKSAQSAVVSHVHCGSPAHSPSKHESPPVQVSPSAQAVSSATSWEEHCPLRGLHSYVRHGSGASHVTMVSGFTSHCPALQRSVPLHRSPSSKAPQSASVPQLQSPVSVPAQTPAAHTSPVVQGSPSSHWPTTPVFAQPEPGLHPSAVQSFPSSQSSHASPAPSQAPETHQDSRLQGLPSSQGAPSGEPTTSQRPLSSSQIATVQISTPSAAQSEWSEHSAPRLLPPAVSSPTSPADPASIPLPPVGSPSVPLSQPAAVKLRTMAVAKTMARRMAGAPGCGEAADPTQPPAQAQGASRVLADRAIASRMCRGRCSTVPQWNQQVPRSGSRTPTSVQPAARATGASAREALQGLGFTHPMNSPRQS